MGRQLNAMQPIFEIPYAVLETLFDITTLPCISGSRLSLRWAIEVSHGKFTSIEMRLETSPVACYGPP